MKLLMGPSMTILAWYVAGQWIRGSERSQLRHGPSVLSENSQAKKRRPTPAQFAILQNIFISTGITALLDAVTYSFRLTGTTKKLRKTKVPSPSYFRLSVAVFAILLVLNYACMLLDTALHFTTRQAVAGLPVQPQDLIYPGSTKEFGRSLNTSKAMMDIYVGPGPDYNHQGPQILRIRSNTSALNRMAWTDQASTLLVAPTSPPFSYMASSIGIRATCQSISSECDCHDTIICSPTGAGTIFTPFCIGPHALNLSGSPVTSIGGTFDSALSETGQPIAFANIASNLFPYATVIHSRAYLGEGTPDRTGFMSASGSRSYTGNAWNILFCQITVGGIRFRFDPPSRYTEQSFTPMSVQDTQLVGHIVDQGSRVLTDDAQVPLAEGISTVIDGTGLMPDSEPYESAFERNLAKSMLSLASIMAIPEADSVRLLGKTTSGARILWPLLLAYTLCAGLLACVTLFVGILAICAGTSRSILVGPLQMRLRSTTGIVSQCMGDPNPSPKAQFGTDQLDVFAPETEEHRLDVQQGWIRDHISGVVVGTTRTTENGVDAGMKC
ncbi:unnamed protein product [Tilletia controversa]|nr:unnamed protein product [Tilletia controversa]